MTPGTLARQTRGLGWVVAPSYGTLYAEKGSILVFLGDAVGPYVGLYSSRNDCPHTFWQLNGQVVFRYETMEDVVYTLKWIEILQQEK